MISILIATYNSEKTIRRCLDSVVNQQMDDWECIIIDGLSSDKTLKIVSEYEFRDNRFRHISEHDRGVFDALNKGIALSVGEWIYVLGSDDIIISDGLYSFVPYMGKKHDVLYGDAVALFTNGERRIRTKELSYLRYNMITSHQAFIIRKDAILREGCFDIRFRLCADFDMIQKLYLHNASFFYIKKDIVLYSQEGLSSRFSLKNDWNKYLVSKKNKANKCPLFFFMVDEMKWILVQIRNRVLQ